MLLHLIILYNREYYLISTLIDILIDVFNSVDSTTNLYINISLVFTEEIQVIRDYLLVA